MLAVDEYARSKASCENMGFLHHCSGDARTRPSRRRNFGVTIENFKSWWNLVVIGQEKFGPLKEPRA